MGRYPFGVELFHLLLHAGLSRRFLKYSNRNDTLGSCPTSDHRWSAQHQDLDVLGCVGAGSQRKPAQHTSKHQIDCPKATAGDHAWLPLDGDGEVGLP